jgi:hypothetical protein
MKPDWKDAPDWANYLAQDFDGEWHWFEERPYYDYSGDFWVRTSGDYMEVISKNPGCSSSLEANPKGF